MRKLPKIDDENIVASIGEDVAAYRFHNQLLLQTVDMITPVVNDPYDFGAIAAANALSDIYAKGGVPLFALNILGFPTNTLPLSYLEEMIRGGADKAIEAGISVLGGHTIDDAPKYGLSVTGYIPEGKTFVSKANARPKDVVVLTKPLGSGVYTTAIDHGLATDEQVKEVTELMIELNKSASEAMQTCNVHACTDVTGFGLIGHLTDIAEQSGVTIEINFKNIPFLKDALSLIQRGAISEGLINNQHSFRNHISKIHPISIDEEQLLFDPQTSGGLIIIVSEEEVDKLKRELRNKNVFGVQIGQVTSKQETNIQII